MTGLHLSHYRIDSELGRGGMGVVYKAFDTQLDRAVALKVLPASALASEDDRARFFREAKAAASISHPNVCHVYQVDEAQPLTEEGQPVEGQTEKRLFIAMEYIQGETLYDYVKKGPLRLQEAVSIAGQIAEALKEAHAKEIVHRDIKSANVMLTETGVAKVLDFGLAKTNQSTMLTRLGSTLGTVAYMSPEQARGEEVDGRSDLYSLGTVLYEMVAGRLPFAGDYEQAVVYSILNEPPEPLTAIRTGVPMQLEWIINKLLSKEAEYRYQSAAGLLADLKSLDLSGSGMSRRSMPAVDSAGTLATGQPAERILLKWGWSLVVAALAAGAVIGWFSNPATESPTNDVVVSFSVPLDSTERFARGDREVAIAPNGRTLAYLTTTGVFLRHLSDTETSIPLAGLDSPRSMFFSPDSEWLGFVSTSKSQLMKVSVAGGSPLPIAPLPDGLSVFGASWGSDGYIYLGFGEEGMGRVSGSGGIVEMLTDSTESGGYLSANILPDGRTLMYTFIRGETAGNFLAKGEIRFLDLPTGRDTLFHPGGSEARYVGTGHIVFLRDGFLYAIPFDTGQLEATGAPFPVSDRVGGAISGQFDLSTNGTLSKVSDAYDSVRRLDWLAPDGTIEALSPDLRGFRMPRIQPGLGAKVAVEFLGETWIYDAVAGTSTRLASGLWPIWSPDGSRVAYSGGGVGVLSRSVSSPEAVDTLLVADANLSIQTTSWSPDGRHIALSVGPPTASDLYILNVESKEIEPFLENDFDVDFGAFSPDGKWLAYESNEGDGVRDEIFLRRFPGRDGLVRVSSNGGTKAVWRPDGLAIYYVNASGHIEETEVTPESGTIGTSREIYSGPLEPSFGFDVHPLDGRLLIRSTPSVEEGERIDIVINWATKLTEGG